MVRALPTSLMRACQSVNTVAECSKLRSARHRVRIVLSTKTETFGEVFARLPLLLGTIFPLSFMTGNLVEENFVSGSKTWLFHGVFILV